MKLPSSPALVFIGGLALFGAVVVPRAFDAASRERGEVPVAANPTAAHSTAAAQPEPSSATPAAAVGPSAAVPSTPVVPAWGGSAAALDPKPVAPVPSSRSTRPEDQKPSGQGRPRPSGPGAGGSNGTGIHVSGDAEIWVNGQRLQPRADGTIDPALLNGAAGLADESTRTSVPAALNRIRGRLLRCAELPGADAWSGRQATAELEVTRDADGGASVNLLSLNGVRPADQASLCVMDALNAGNILPPAVGAGPIRITLPIRF